MTSEGPCEVPPQGTIISWDPEDYSWSESARVVFSPYAVFGISRGLGHLMIFESALCRKANTG